MNSGVKPYLFRVKLIISLSLLLGLLFSLTIYLANNLVLKNNNDLILNRLPVLMNINYVIADIDTQQRIFYEYYADQNEALFRNKFNSNKEHLDQYIAELTKHTAFAANLNIIQAKQKQIESLVIKFHQIMRLKQSNWDELRKLLAKMSQLRLVMLPPLHKIESITQLALVQGHKQVIFQLDLTHYLVIFYAIAILLLAGIVAWYIKQYLLTSAKNTRLSLFPKFNPNPVLSFDDQGKLVFHNPASERLLVELGFLTTDVKKLIPNNFNVIRQQLSQAEKHTITIEHLLEDHILQLNINWLSELGAYDIHILDITEQKLAKQRIHYLAFYVQSTNLPNQFKLMDDVGSLIAVQKDFYFGLFEIRDFNRLVTVHGIDSNVALIKELMVMIQAGIDSKHKLYHLDQNQFALLCVDIASDKLINTFVDNISQLAEKAIKTECGDFFVELDFGFSHYSQQFDKYNVLYKNAHTALNIAAADKYNNNVIYCDAYAQELAINASMLDDLRLVLDKDELFLVFQPQLNLTTRRISGLETLVRWRHQGKIISPETFIPLAEQSGLIVPIGHWILWQGCVFAKRLVDLGYEDIVVAINVSPRQFSHPDFVQSVKNVLEQTKLNAKNLELEITEGIVMHNELEILSVLNKLKALGLQLSIDDFGTGYSSLSYLKRFPIDKLKIDQSFIRHCHENDEDKAIVKTIVALGKNLDISLIAEGVEELTHLKFLQTLACDEIQGYWFSKPIIAEDLIIFLANHKIDTIF